MVLFYRWSYSCLYFLCSVHERKFPDVQGQSTYSKFSSVQPIPNSISSLAASPNLELFFSGKWLITSLLRPYGLHRDRAKPTKSIFAAAKQSVDKPGISQTPRTRSRDHTIGFNVFIATHNTLVALLVLPVGFEALPLPRRFGKADDSR